MDLPLIWAFIIAFAVFMLSSQQQAHTAFFAQCTLSHENGLRAHINGNDEPTILFVIIVAVAVFVVALVIVVTFIRRWDWIGHILVVDNIFTKLANGETHRVIAVITDKTRPVETCANGT